MKEILYDIFIRGVIPFAILGMLGYLGKLFFEKYKSHSSKVIRIFILVFIWLISNYLIYDSKSSGYLKDYLPGETQIVGAPSIADSTGVYWELLTDQVYSIPLRVRPNRIHLLKFHTSLYPITITYQIGTEYHSITLNNIDTPIFNLPLEELVNSQNVISNEINLEGERILNLRFKVNKTSKLLSFSLTRHFSRSFQILITLFFALLIGLPLILINHLFKKPDSQGDKFTG